MTAKVRFHIFALLLAAVTLAGGCRKEDMAQQPRYEPMTPSPFFADGKSARSLVEGTVDRSGTLTIGYTFDKNAGMEYGGDFPPDFPRSGDALLAKLQQGQQRYAIYCSVCHGDLGDGHGMVVRRGFTRPPAFYPLAADKTQTPDLYAREVQFVDPQHPLQPGYIYKQITNGSGAMLSYAARVSPTDRWAIAAYIKALQASQYADINHLPPKDQRQVQTGMAHDVISGGPATQPQKNQPRNEP
jgi:mono/diheme cytochrome c family protein